MTRAALRVATACASICALLTTEHAAAQQAPTEPPAVHAPRHEGEEAEPRPHDQREQAHAAIQRRPVPDYGRPPERTDAADILLWVPRVIFFPVYLLFEYGVRVPLGWLLRAIELSHIDSIFSHGMTQTESEHPSLWRFSPIFRFDYGFLPTVGLAFDVHDEAQRYQLGVGFSFWGPDQVRGTVTGSVRVDDTRFVLDAFGSFRDDQIWNGLGWSAPAWPRARYAHALGAGDLYLTHRFWRSSSFSFGGRIGIHRFSNSDFRQDHDLSIAEANVVTGLMPPPGYAEGYTAAEPWARVVVDTRSQLAERHATGARVEAYGSWAANIEQGIDQSWARAGASFEVAREVMKDRSLHLRGMAELVEPIGRASVPFTEQVWLSGIMGRMPGYLAGRLIGLSGTSVGVSWRYALGAWFDAELFVDVGNVFAEHFQDFDVARLRLSAGTALMAHRRRDFTILVALGTEPFVLGATVSSARVLVTVGLPP